MLDSFELEINRYLKAGRPLDEVARSLRDLWKRGGLSPYDQNVVALFLARAGQTEDLFHLAQIAVERENPVPWTAILETLRSLPTAATKHLIDAIFVGSAVEDKLNEIALATDGESLDPRFKKLRHEAGVAYRAEKEAQLQSGLEKLLQLRRDRLFEAEENLLAHLSLEFPTHPKLLNLFSQMKSRQARDVLEKRHRDLNHARVMDELVNPLAEEVLDSNDQIWAENLVTLAKAEPHMAHDLAIALIQMNLTALAQKALQFATVSHERDSLLLDLMIQMRQFLDALTHAEAFEKIYDAHAESAFTSMYARARALWGLGRREDGVRLLEGLLKLRPTYRSAQALLTEWKGSRL